MGDDGKTFFQNVCKFVPDNSESHPKARNLYTNHNENFTYHNIEVT